MQSDSICIITVCKAVCWNVQTAVFFVKPYFYCNIEPEYQKSEIRDYRKLKEIGIKMPSMLETDVKNERILKEFIDGDTIYQLVLEDKMKTDYIGQLHRMCELLYAANTNIDYFPTNFVVHNEEIYYVDFECNDYMEEWNFENWGVKYWSKTPEFLQYVKEHS